MQRTLDEFAYDEENVSYTCPSWAPIVGFTGIACAVVFASKLYMMCTSFIVLTDYFVASRQYSTTITFVLGRTWVERIVAMKCRLHNLSSSPTLAHPSSSPFCRHWWCLRHGTCRYWNHGIGHSITGTFDEEHYSCRHGRCAGHLRPHCCRHSKWKNVHADARVAVFHLLAVQCL